ncbi:MAG TPA: NAD(P)-binding domain-containing protein, partial [Edaphobacter sp.]|nr:NAD(P)-binding domain-containing protein [Edaphobacter sp.]
MKQFREFHTVIIGGGQAGLSVSYHLKLEGRDHIVLEQAARAANTWRNHRWDSFTLNNPNWQSQLQGAGIPGKDPDGFLSRDELVSYFEEYIQQNRLPIRYETLVFTVKAVADGYAVETTAGTFRAKNVVVATGACQKPHIPRFKGALSPDIRQLHSDSYRNPDSLPAGAVLVVGSAQSGAQIAEELYQSGRRVYLSVSRSGRVPRRYRGRDINWWRNTLGLYERTVDQLTSLREKFGSYAHVSGAQGGRTLNLHRFASDGVTLLGRVTGLDSAIVGLARDLHKNLAAADQWEANLVTRIDSYIEKRELTIPQEVLPQFTGGFAQPERDELDLRQANVGSVIWATGYSFDFSMVRLPVFDASGYPIQQRGVTIYPGLYFVGLPWLHKAKSGLLFGVS